MEVSKIQIPKNDIYNVHVLDKHGDTKTIILFCGSTLNDYNVHELFSKDEIEYYKRQDIQIVYSKFLIHKDDTISILKKKILLELGIHEVTYDEMYLFVKSMENIHTNHVYQKITQNETILITPVLLKQLLINIGLRDEEIEKLMDTVEKKSDYGYEDIAKIMDSSRLYPIVRPLGQEFSGERDYLYSANPFRINGVGTIDFRKNSFIQFENELLFNYGNIENQTIFLCLFEDVMENPDNEILEKEYLVQTYYPFLYRNSIFSLDDYRRNKQKLIKKNEEIINKQTKYFFDTIKIFYDIFYGRTENGGKMDYVNRGIQKIKFRIKSEFNILLPLEIIFKNIHSSKEIPFIKYNPGNRRENVYRLYTEKKSRDGRNIPLLSESTILKLSREIGKNKQVSLFIQGETPFIIDLEANGDVIISSELKKPLLETELLELIRESINPVISNINSFIDNTGYNINLFESFYKKNVEIENIQYISEFLLEKELNLNKYSGCLSSVFDILEEKDNIIRMRYKRVENFKEMDAQTLLITDVLKKTNNMVDVINELMKNYKMTEDAAQLRIVNYLGEHKDIRGKIVDNPGFQVLFKISQLDKRLYIEVNDIISMNYISCLHIYLDSFLRITQHPETTSINKKSVLDLCSKMSKYENINISHVENVISTAIIEPVKNVPKPISLEEDDEENGGILFDDYLSEAEITNDEELDEGEEIMEDDEKGIMYTDLDEEPEAPADTIKEPPEPPESKISEAPADIIKEPPEPQGNPTIIGTITNTIQNIFTGEKKEETKQESTPESTSSTSSSPEGIFFDEEEEEEEEDEEPEEENKRPQKGGKKKTAQKGGEEDDDTTQEKEFQANPAGKPLKHPNLFYAMMKERDPDLFSIEEDNQYTSYSRVCASNLKLQPVILTKKEFEKINKENPGSYTDYIKYGSDPEDPYYYICPRYWCLLNNTSMTEEDVKAGKCAKQGVPDKIIPKDAKVVPTDAFVYEFNNPKEHINDKNEYITHYPGFKKGYHNKGYGLPCCFKKPKQNWEFNQETNMDIADIKKKKEKRIDFEKNNLYIISNETFPIKMRNRFGFLPISVQKFLRTNNNDAVTKNNAALIKPNTECFLRYGVEQFNKQSILGSVAELYAYSHNLKISPSVKELKNIMVNAITIDKFIYYNNSYLISVFRPKRNEDIEFDIDIEKYANSELYKRLNLNDESQNDFMEDTVAAYENFIQFLLSDNSTIDHTYIWDIITDDNPLFIKGGINLVILEIVDNDITDNIKVLCPTNSQRNKLYDSRKETMILLKKDEYYEPIYIYKDINGEIQKTKTFFNQMNLKNMKILLNNIEKYTNLNCSSLPSLPKLYKFKKNIHIDKLYNLLKEYNYFIVYQIFNYQGKIIGVVVNQTENGDAAENIFIPCYPSANINSMSDIPKKMADDDIWTDYQNTVNELTEIHKKTNGKILCSPKIKVLEDNLIVGILTETNQFVKIDPPSENVFADNLPTVSSTDYVEADKVITSTRKIDTERNIMVKKISLESQFYSLFRSTIRNYLKDYENRKIREQIIKTIENGDFMYNQKISKIVDSLRHLVADKIMFGIIDEEILLKLENLSCFGANCGKTKYCIKTEENQCQLVIPKNHLISNLDNERIYYARVADELLRYKRIQLFMLQPKTYLNITNTDYSIHNDEFILIQTNLNNDYFKNLIPFNETKNIHHLNYDNAAPAVSQSYPNEAIPLNEQYEKVEKVDNQFNEYILECIKETKEVIGNPHTSYWKKLFPDKSREIVFKGNNPDCSFYILVSIFYDKYKEIVSVQSIKVALWNGYKDFSVRYREKIFSLWRKQGKKDIVQKIKAGVYTMESAIMSEEYFLTDLDIWIFSMRTKIQVCIFSTYNLQSLDDSVGWLIVGRNYKEKHYFIRTPLAKPNTIPSYHLVTPAYHLGELPDFESNLQQILSGRKKDGEKNIQTIEQFLGNYVV